ncbi:maleylpyruvate isomerase N-terminal domain-containing protein [Mycolicibacterium cosmeticum]|uniref:maleylpyruvate isomerase N-terminal domain-containing protein n=1 Tax=Mycolicibacterium cosmeticum TaxID=258533 RepID=UPI003204E655
MSDAGIRGMRAAGEDALALAAALTTEQWSLESAATGWSVKDVYLHIGALLALLQAAVNGAEVPPVGIEPLNNRIVAQRRDWSVNQATDFLREQLDSATQTFEPLQDEPAASTAVPLLDLGTYPLHSIADMFAFDISTHIRLDVTSPRGPVEAVLPALDETRLAPAVSWLIGGLQQMQAELKSAILKPISLHLTGPAARTIQISRSTDAVVVNEPPSSVEQSAVTLTSTTADFLAWSTRRLAWTNVVQVDGDHAVAATFLDTVNLI